MLEKLRRATLGTYEIRGELGRGGMAVVYLARDLRLDRSVAIKVMLPGLFLTQGMAERFLQEARIAARLYHPNIIIVHAVEQTDDLFYFVMNLVEGAAVDELLRLRTPLAIDEVRWILLQAARALGHAHGEGVVHRDVKPANLMINTKGDLVVSDFGIAKVGESSHLTRTGAAIGTPAYMSPEQVMGLEVGAPSDQYSLGVAAFEMLTGRPPFGGAVLQIQWAHANDAPPSLRELRPDCPPALVDAIARMLAKKPEERWPSFDALLPVFGEGLPADGGAARRQLLEAANTIRAQRVTAQPELVARTPLSPIPTDIRSAPARDRAAHAMMVRCSPQTVTVSAGEMVTVRATVTDARGMVLSQVPLSWRSSDERIAGVSPRGDVLARAAGRATITASVGQISGEAVVVVEDAPVVRVVVVSPSPVVRVHERVLLTARALDVRGEARAGATVEWSSSAPEIASVAADGTVSGVRTGRATIRARVGSVEGSTTLDVESAGVAMVRILPEAPSVEVGDQAMLVAEALDAVGGVVDARTTLWEIADARIGTIDQSGVVTGVSPGRVRVRATVDGIRAEKTLAVRAVPLAAIALRLDAERLHAGDTTAVRLTGRDVHGRDVSPVPLTQATFTSSAPEIVAIDALGGVQALAVGTADLGVSLPPGGGTDPVGAALLQATLRVTVAPARAASIVVSPDALALESEEASRVTASVLSATGVPLPERVLQWSTLDPSIATVRDGVVTGLAVGATRVRVTCDGVTTEIPVAVTSPTVRELRVEAVTSTLYVGDTITLSAVALDRNGSRVRDAQIAWRTNAPSILSVGADGTARGLAPGEATVVATCGTLKASGKVAVDEVPVTALRVSPAKATVSVGRTVALDVLATDVRGKEVGTLVMWTASPAGLVSVGADGVVSARAPGVALITASRGDLRALAEVTVEAPVARAIRLSSTVRTLRVGERATVQATVLAEDGEALALPVEWTTDDVGVARVSARGEIEAVGVGAVRITARAGEARAALAIDVSAAAPVEAAVSVGSPQRSTRSPLLLVGGGVAVVGAIVAAMMMGGDDTNAPAPMRPSMVPAPTAEPPAPSTPSPGASTDTQTSPRAPDVSPSAALPATTPPAEAARDAVLEVRGPRTLTVGATGPLRIDRVVGTSRARVDAGEARFASSAPRIASVDDDGVVRARGLGVATVTVRLDGARSAQWNVRVEGTRSDSVAAGMVVAAPPTRGGTAPPPTVAPTPTPTPSPKPDLPAGPAPVVPRPETTAPVAEASASDADVARVVRAWAGGLRKGAAPEALKDFFGGGSKHVAALGDGPNSVSKEGASRTVSYVLLLSRVSFVGAPQRYRATVTATVTGAGEGASLGRVSVGGVQEVK